MDSRLLIAQLRELAQADSWFVPLLANAAALLYDALPDINWAGFYIVRGDHLTLGPFQGKTACVRIPRDKGVCGAAWREKRTLRVDDVHRFPGHIACYSASNAEIVIPLRDGTGDVTAVLDIDSPVFSRFTEADQAALESFAQAMETLAQWT